MSEKDSVYSVTLKQLETVLDNCPSGILNETGEPIPYDLLLASVKELAANYERTKLALRVTKQQRDELVLRGALPVVERLERIAEAHRKAQDQAAEVFSQAAYAIVSLENDLTALRTAKDAVIDERNKAVFELTNRVSELEAKVCRAGRWLCNIRQKLTFLKSYHKTIQTSELASTLADIECAISVVSPKDARPFNPQRYAELDQADCDARARVVALEKRVADLQSQLAWTPVSAGLPTEPGDYEFLRAEGVGIKHYKRYDHPIFPWSLQETGETELYSDAEVLCEAYECYRRIELPKDGEI